MGYSGAGQQFRKSMMLDSTGETKSPAFHDLDLNSIVGNMAKPAPRRTDPKTIGAEILEKLAYAIGKDPIVAKPHDWLAATILALRDRIIDRWMDSTRATYKAGAKRVYYLSLEFLIGRLLRDALSNLELTSAFKAALDELGVDLDIVAELEADAALGNGGLGRLAACFMESMASLDIPAYGYGIRYDHGLFRQKIIDGWQVELPENWLENGNPWEFPRREAAYEIGFGGGVTVETAADGKQRRRWQPAEKIMATACDTPVVGWRGRRVNTLRLWTARAIDPIRLEASTAATMPAPSTPATAPKSSAGCCTLPMPRRRARNSGCARNSSSPRRPCRTFCAATRNNSAMSGTLPTRWRSSSTIRTRPSPLSN